MAALPERTMQLWGVPFATWLRQQEGLCLEEKGRKDSCWWAIEKVPHGSGLTGDQGSDTADGAGTKGLSEPQTSISFPEIRYPGLGRGRKDGLCAFVGILRDFGILMKTLSHYSKSV